MKAKSHHQRWNFPLALVAMVMLALGAWAFEAARNSITVDGIQDRQYVNAWLAKQQADLRSGEQSHVYFYDTRNTDTLLQQFVGNAAIERLTFELTDLSDDGVQIIAEFPRIERLTLYGGRPRVGDRGIGLLRGQPTLTTLKIVNIDVTDRGLAVLQTLPHLQHLTLCRHETREELLTDSAVEELRKLTGLVKLNIVGGWVSPPAIDHLRTLLPGCDVVVDANWMRDDESDAQVRRSTVDDYSSPARDR